MQTKLTFFWLFLHIKPNEVKYLKDLDKDTRMILKLILKKQDNTLQKLQVWLQTIENDGLL